MGFRIILIQVFLLFSCASQENMDINHDSGLEQLSTTRQYKTIEGTDENLLSLDIYFHIDTEHKKPVVIYVHGGAWSAGDKSYNLENKINLFERLNYVFVSINYRLSPLPNQSTPDRIKYPMHNLDVADAIKWVIENISQYGGDQHKLALLGHSAGAHLVALTATNSRFMEQIGYNLSNIKGVASIDTEGYNVRSKVLQGSEIYINAFGRDEQENIEASPLYNVQTNEGNPIFFIAKRGSSQRMEVANNFIQELNNHNIETYLVDGNEYSHSGINTAIGSSEDTIITPALISFFERCFE